MKLLEEKIVLVVGGTSGIGAAAARLFASEGASVVVVGRRKVEGDAIVDTIRADRNKAAFIRADVSDASSVRAMTSQVVEQYGRIDCAFNNFGIGDGHRMLVEQDEATWDEVIGINLKGGFNCLQAQLPVMVKQRKGSIVFTGSVLSEVFIPGEAIYSASKGGLTALAKAAAIECAGNGVRINVLNPGLTRTPMTESSFTRDQEGGTERHPLAARHPIGRTAEAHEIAEAALFLLSDRASFITGQALNVDGGYTTQ